MYRGPPWVTDQVIGHPTSVTHTIVVKVSIMNYKYTTLNT